MSWMKHRGHNTTSPANVPTTQMYNSGKQHSNQESNQWQQHDLTADNWFNQGVQNQPKQQPYQYSGTQPDMNYWQQQYPPNSFAQTQPNQYQQQQLHNQHNTQQQNYYPSATGTGRTSNEQYSQQQQPLAQAQQYHYNRGEVQNNPYSLQHQQQVQHQSSVAAQPEQDSWGNWGWGDEDNSNIQTTQNVNTNVNQISNLADSFNVEESWNWSVDENSSNSSTLNYLKPEHSTAATSLTSLESYQSQQQQHQTEHENVTDLLFPTIGKLPDRHNNLLDNSEAQMNKVLPQEAPKLPPGIVKVRNAEHLTPQWSTESQMSQESSDDILQTSESDKMLSRSSTISQSPISGHDALADNMLPQHEAPNKYAQEQPGITLDVAHKQYENVEILSNIKQDANVQNYLTSPVSMAQNNPTPSPPGHNLTPPPLPAAQAAKNHTPPPPPIKNQTPPLMGASLHGPSDDLKNPYKRTTVLSHAAVNKSRILSSGAPDRPQPPGFQPFTQSVNLETLPDNSEQPDSLVPPVGTNQSLKKTAVGLSMGLQMPPAQQIPDNNEVAPINERNQYLETGQLSDESTNQPQSENLDAFPPPGLRRMVLGQIESNDTNLNVPLDEPPPGLSRMVLGQTESSSSLTNVLTPRESNGPPVGFSRMVPGESSSPEASSRHQYQVYQDDRRHEEYNSEIELNQLHGGSVPQTRSATIGADTPPTIANPVTAQSNMNRAEAVGSDSSVSENRLGAMGVERREQRDDNLIGANTDGASLRVGENRRDSIEGQTQDSDLQNLVGGMRDMTVSSDVGMSNNELEQGNKGKSRQESTDSDGEIERNKSPSRDHRDRRYREKDERKEKNRSRYSPDSYREKRYDRRRPRDRRYDDESDYYSDKEKDGRREERKDDYDKKYSSSRSKDKERKRRDGRDPRDRRDDRDGRDGRDVRDSRADREYDRRDRDYHRDYDRRDGRNRNDYYYGHYDESYDGQRSRPSSRSDSLHESYRDRHDRDHRRQRPRERDRDSRRHRDFNPYMQGFNYDPYNPYYQQYQYYYENLRRTNPQAYAEWYRKYYQQASLASSTATFGGEDRGSVHSGRSSANDDIKERYMRQSYYSQTSLPHMGGYYRDTHSVSGQYGLDESSYDRTFDTSEAALLDDIATQAQRSTPAKFSTAHIRASICSGRMVRVLPNYPLDGQNATVEIVNLQNLLPNDDEIEELAGFPGPLVRGVTHKKTVIEYCENKIRNANCNETITDPCSYILLWELMILLIRQNGMVVGTDIAELLMKDRNHDGNVQRPASVASNASSAIIEGNTPSEVSNVQTADIVSGGATSAMKEEFVTNKFREYLIYGSGKEALEWAMKYGLWGHALFLASKLDKRTYANVMMRFANGLTMNDPLQTLYQLLSGRIPAAVTAVSDEKWGDWRPHLAMILSNTTSRPELDRKAITTLADTLMTRGSVYAAQFCYLMAEVGFSRYGASNAKLVLLGSNHQKPFVQFATNEAIHLTEIYEYACSLNDAGFIIVEFQPYKYLLASRLSDRGLLEKSLAYLEKISVAIIQNPSAAQLSLIDRVCDLADKLKYYDPVGDADDSSAVEGDLDLSRPDNSWLKNLRLVQNNYNMGLISHESVNSLIDGPPDYESLTSQQVPPYENQAQVPDMLQNQQAQQYADQYQSAAGGYGQWQTTEQQIDQQQIYPEQLQQTEQQEGYGAQYQDQQPNNYWPQQTQQPWSGGESQPVINYGVGGQTVQENQLELDSHQPQTDYNSWRNAQNEPEGTDSKSPKEDTAAGMRPQITMPNQAKRQNSVDAGGNTGADEKMAQASPAKKKSVQKNEKPGSGSGWFGGIFSRMGLRPKNQMKLPDDKNPSIVWDPEKKKWVNLDEDGTETTNEIKPPPTMSELMPKLQQDGGVMPPTGIPDQTSTSSYHHHHHQHANPYNNMSEQYSLGQVQRVPNVPGQLPYGNAPANPAETGNTAGIPGAAATMPVGDEPPKMAQPNMFKLQRGRNLKKSYVDVFNPSGKSSDNAQSVMQNSMFSMGGGAPSSNGQMNFFVPAPVNDPNAPMDFLTPAATSIENKNQVTYQQQPQ